MLSDWKHFLKHSANAKITNMFVKLLVKVVLYFLSKSNTEYWDAFRHVNATKSYLHFDRFAGEAILCSNFFCFSLFLDVLFLS